MKAIMTRRKTNVPTHGVALTTGESKAIHTMGVKTNASFSHLQFEFL